MPLANLSAFDDLLIDRTENAAAIPIRHFHSDPVTETHEWRKRFTMLDRFEHASFCKAARPFGTIII